jgi:exopolyphosphatase/guanosine-5'-triphosphate,3'-diphosphate pyrophosphatase
MRNSGTNSVGGSNLCSQPQSRPSEVLPMNMDQRGSSSILASIDLGSHTARMLIARWIEEESFLKPLLRERAYIRLAQDFEAPEELTIKADAVGRAVRSLKGFKERSRAFALSWIQAVATGVVREAVNRDDFVRCLQKTTGIPVRVLSGKEEARLTGLGVSQSLDVRGEPFVAFDLGGGSTEFLFSGTARPEALSVALGAALLTGKFLASDPPREEEITRARAKVTEVVERFLPGLPRMGCCRIIGTGGTVTALAAMIHGLDPEQIRPERMNGLMVKTAQVERLFAQMSKMPLSERVKMPGLDEGRAEVILGGTLAALGILKFFKTSEMMISLSDLLEGVLYERLGYSLTAGHS